MKTGLLLQIGQCAEQISTEIHKIERKLGIDGKYQHVVAEIGRSVSHRDTIYSNEDIEHIMAQVQHQVEELTHLREVCVVIDICNARGMSCLVNELAQRYAGSCLNSFALNYHGFQGLHALNATLNLQSLLCNCDSVCLRNAADARMMLEKEHIVDFDISTLNRVVAADMSVILNVDNRHLSLDQILFPRDILSVRSKLYDVRSSLWKALQPRSSTKKFNSLRSMANNLHALHSMYNKTPSSSLEAFSFVSSASIVDVDLMATELPATLVSSPCTCAGADVDVALRWATAGIKWSSNLGGLSTSSRRDIAAPRNRSRISSSGTAAEDSGGSSYAGTGASSRGSIIGSRSQQQSRISSVSMSASTAGKDNILSDSSSEGVKITALSFLSPYGLIDLHNLTVTSSQLIKADAYSWRIGDSDCLISAVNDISSYVEDQKYMFSET